jgi:hypothetical protein
MFASKSSGVDKFRIADNSSSVHHFPPLESRTAKLTLRLHQIRVLFPCWRAYEPDHSARITSAGSILLALRIGK